MSYAGSVPTRAFAVHQLSRADFEADRHAARYLGEFEGHPEAMQRLIDLLNRQESIVRLVDAEQHFGFPALSGIVVAIEDDPAIEVILRAGSEGHRFRQAVGVAVRLRMAAEGWRTTGRKGTVRGARYFTKAEHYESAPSDDRRSRGLAALDAVAQIGDDEERAATGRDLLDALAATRAAEGRVF